jgi:poly(hydroxyalkanoate) depolymerase family esterase
MRRFVLPALLALVGLLAVPAAAERKPGPAGERQHGSYSAPGLPTRAYALYVPSSVAAKPHKRVPLLVYLHGCNQDADDAATGTRLEQLAEEKDLLVLFPQQTKAENSSYPVADGNGAQCWNWFVPDHMTRGSGEPATIAGMTREVMSRFAVDADRVWIGGVSAGGAMTSVLAATYPDLYAAAAPIAGCAYRACSDADGTAAYAAMGTHARAVPTLIIQSDTDMVDNVAMGGVSALRQSVSTNDLADDGDDNGSVPDSPTSTTHHEAEQGTPPGDPCVGNKRLPCLGGVLGLKSYPYSVFEFGSTVTALVIHGANHAWTGGNPEGTFVDPVGPDMGHAMYDFFAAHARR